MMNGDLAEDVRPRKLLFRGRICHSLGPQELEIIPDGLLGVRDGSIAFLYEATSIEALEDFLLAEDFADAERIELHQQQFLFPGMFDTHIHAPQYPNAGFGLDMPLLDWLERYTFPTESSMRDPELAKNVYDRVVRQTLRQGTTFACYYSSIHVAATEILAQTCLRYGQRAFVGKCNMDKLSPAHYRETCEDSLVATRECIDICHRLDPSRQLLEYCITPRFAPSCSSELMSSLGQLARELNLPVQTHISENKAELAMVKEMFPEHIDYTDVYEKHGLVGRRTILAHAIYLSDDELRRIQESDAAISHCPASNTGISSGEAPIREMLDRDMNVGLGTDVSGGYTASILDSAKLACLVSRHRAIHTGNNRLAIDVAEALYLATLGGARVCKAQDRLGNFVAGKDFDALLIDLSQQRNGRVDVFEGEEDLKIVEKWMWNGDDRNIARVYVRGQVVLES
ncbi:hypothetical protein PYCC9005_003332 [Savitreella phatthalungensis]